MKSVNFLDNSQVKAILFYTTPNTKLDGTIDLAITQYIYIRKATIRLKSFNYCKTPSSNCSIASLLV
jgi:hypothetical protein